jgi:hypothetical protein
MTIPLSKFSGYLKQMKRDLLDDAVKVVMDNAFPGFLPSDPNSDEIQRQEKIFRELEVTYVLQDLSTPRRFSGGSNLPRGRYYSLSLDEFGDDKGTLTNELNTYLDPLRGGLVIFGDMALPGIAKVFEQQYGVEVSEGSYLVIFVIGRPGAISPVIDTLLEQNLFSIEEISDQRKGYSTVAFQVPYLVSPYEIDDVFDLRLPECQNFLVEYFFKRDTPNLTKENRAGISRFVDTLPMLMSPEIGGGNINSQNQQILTALVAFIRSQGAKALVYPSARSNVGLDIENGNLRNWRGWCLVDYREAESPMMQSFYDLSSGWPTRFPKGSSIRVAENEIFAGSFEINGIVEWNRERVGHLEREFLDRQKP